MSQDITVTDLFCGAGGSSIGAEAAGARLVMAANHWRLAIDTHNSNFPNANHDCADISQVRPSRYPTTDVLIASPECTNHSGAKTKKAEATLWDPKAADEEERSRATMWDVVRFTEYHRYKLIVVENVVEATRWTPFRSWLGAMHDFGYEHKALFLNSMIAHPTPQSRDRMYVVFWLKGNPAPDLDFRPIAWCATCERDVEAIQSWKRPERAIGKYRAQYVYRCPVDATIALPYAWPAAAAIDWALPTPRIGDRSRPLADATVRRIKAGLERYGSSAIIQAAGHTYERPGYYRTWPTWVPLGTQTTTIQHGLVLDTAYAHASDEQKVRPVSEPGRTQTGQQTQALLVPAGGTWNDEARPVDDPFRTRTVREAEALVVTMRGTSDAAIAATVHPADEPVGPVTTGIHEALVVPMREHGLALPSDGAPINTQVATASVHALVVPLRTNGKALPANEAPVPTLVAGNPNHALLIRGYTPRGDWAQMAKPVSEPTGTVTAQDHHGLLIDYHGAGKPARSTNLPHRVMDSNDRYALISPDIDIDDCGFRMLEPHEIGRAMAFKDDYVVLGNKRERVRQYGNAVTPPIMSMILERAIGSLAGGN